MSRSYKKPWLKDPSNSYMKKIHARAFRSRCRQISRVFTKDFTFGLVDPVYPSKHEITNQYDICDYCFYVPAVYWRGRHAGEDNFLEHLKACRK